MGVDVASPVVVAQTRTETASSAARAHSVDHNTRSFVKMLRNAFKAINEHRMAAIDSIKKRNAKKMEEALAKGEEFFLDNCNDRTGRLYASGLEAKFSMDTTFSSPLQLEHFEHDDPNQECRPRMEDYHFYQELDNGVLTGVFDGHGGKIGGNPQELAKLVGERFAKNFPNKLSENNGDVHKTFMELCSEIQQEVEAKGNEDERWQYFGSTAVISFVDKRTHKIYTATIGDAEAHIYRKINGKCKAIPLSPIRDWGYRKEIARAQRVAEKCSYVKARMNKWPLDARCKRFPDKTNQYGINTSRSFGDSAYTMAKFDKKDKDKYDTAVISKSKITVNELQPGDILVLACDGLREAWDLCKEEPLDIDEIEEGIIGTLTTENQQEDLAKSLVRHAVDVQHSQDNVSVIAVKVS